MMLTYQGLNVPNGWREERRIVHGEAIKLNYPDFSGNYRYRGAVDNHNVLRDDGGTKSQTGLQIAWLKTWRPIRVFDLFIAFTEVNTYLSLKYFLKMDETFMKFWELFPKALIYN